MPVDGHIAHGLGAVLDAPVTAIEFKDAFRTGLLGRQADDGKDDFAALGARLQVGDGGLDAADLGDVGKAQIKVSVASRNRSWRLGVRNSCLRVTQPIASWMAGCLAGRTDKCAGISVATDELAERVGFEPTVRSRVHLISSQARSATPAPLRGYPAARGAADWLV